MNPDPLVAAYLAKGSDYQPRTEHLNSDGSPRFINRLILEDSPYLLQHAHNPVDWHPWGNEAFDKARRENKPIFLSIGYSTCHWCHVMERESFENLAVARLLNDHFVAIKVDRETRPDLDDTYMTAVTLISGQGGWPMSSFLSPDGKPFFGGTYYPPENFSRLLNRIAELWRDRQSDLLDQADRLSQAIERAQGARGEPQPLAKGIADRAVAEILGQYDALQGGFGQAPKFPHEPLLYLLLDQLQRQPQPEPLEALVTTLDHMARGGIYDQVGGGFHRYSTDNDWLVPHFEKMLYNQAHLARIYLRAWRLTNRPALRRVAEETLDYVLREMTDARGRFFSATDADSEGVEGAFFVWRPEEIDAALSREDAQLASSLYSISEAGNFEGRNIPFLRQDLESFAADHNLPLAELEPRLARIKALLREAREQRPPPIRDDKVIVAWNGMMIGALAEAAQALGRDDYARAAARAASALWQSNRREDGGLFRIHKDGRSSVVAVLEDYVFLAEGLLQLYDLTAERDWLDHARSLHEQVVARFGDRDGGFFLAEQSIDPTAMARPRDSATDGAIPSTSGILLQVIQRLWHRTGDRHLAAEAQAMIQAHAARIEAAPSAYATLLAAAASGSDGEVADLAYAAHGGIRIRGQMESADRLVIDIHLDGDLHVNAAQPSGDGLVGTQVQVESPHWTQTAVVYPEPRLEPLAFQPEPLAIYAQSARVTVGLQRQSAGLTALIPVRVRLQACTDKLCLPPEEVRLMVREAAPLGDTRT